MVNKSTAAAAAAAATVTKRPFGQLAPKWNRILRGEYLNPDTERHFPQLADYEKCILNECVRNTYNKFTHINKLKKRIPTCFVCASMARQSFVMMMAMPHNTLSIGQRIKEFYEKMVPEIEKHFHVSHSQGV